MTITQAVEIVDKRRIESFRGTGYTPNEEVRMQTELNTIYRLEPLSRMVEVACGLMKRVPPDAAIAGVLATAFRFGIDVRKLLQRANAEPQPTPECPEESQPQTE